MKHKIHGFFQVADPAAKAAHLMAHRNDKPIAVISKAAKRSSPRVGRPPPRTFHPIVLHRGYKDRITLAPVWGPKP